MLDGTLFLSAFGLLAGFTDASQPGAAKPVAAPMRDLQWGSLNFLHTTDTHGWHGGHLQESQYSADWGDYISFASHLRKKADEEGRDLLLVDSGDRVDGNGLYDASTPKGNYTYDIFREQHIDIICSGNHELYQPDTVNREHARNIPNFKSNYVASNLDYIDPRTGDRMPMAQRYRKFETKNQKLTVVAFGFIFDFTNNANNSVIQRVEDTVKEKWFLEAIHEKCDVIVVAGHVGARMEEFKTVFTAIRKENWFTPIVFLGGHAHVRDAVSFDPRAFAMASGRYLETIGWLSVDGIKKKSQDINKASVSFQRRYIDNNLLGMYHHTGLNDTTFPTDKGRNVSRMITEARKNLKLDEVYGCAPKDLWMSRTPFDADDSVYTWLKHEVLPDVIVNEQRKDKARLAILNTGTIRFDIFKGAFTRDSTYILSPFLNKLRYVPDVPYEVAKKAIKFLNSGDQIYMGTGLDSRELVNPDQRYRREFIAPRTPTPFSFSSEHVKHQRPMGDDESKQPDKDKDREKPDLVPGYTTKDDIGTDGDDAIHEPISFYKIPNVVEAEAGFPENGEPESVDIVFLDFIQPWIVIALKFSGSDIGNEDTQPYTDESFMDLTVGWIKKNWKQDC